MKAPITDLDYYALTPRGRAEIQGARTSLSSAALELLVRMDGMTSVAELKAGMPQTPFDELAQTLESLLRESLICHARESGHDALPFEDIAGIARLHTERAARTRKGSPDVEAGLKSLQRQGYYVRIVRRPAARPQLPVDRQPQIVVIEDEEHLAKFLKHFLTFEGFSVRTASDAKAIAKAMSEAPAPDLVLLDVMLPDANGFQVLTKIRSHERLRAVPVLMLTAEATREAVIKGLSCGADGYVTKPFDTDILLNAIKTIFGLTQTKTCPWELL